ncbi:twin-arginine translocase TatA/TatE family subunit, partial [Gammaproteobacteria bacterium]|nr:twin-arginine translocase TatA/TatE family subunit [Gammaproteobacteria bacterium]
MFQIGFIEILFIGLIILLLFGPERLPEISKVIIKNTTRLKRKFSSFREDIERDIGADEIKQDIFNEFKL